MTDKDRLLWQANLAWMTLDQQNTVELETLRYLERRRGYPIHVDNLLAAVTSFIEKHRK